jgi:hypothetical protein
MSESKIKKDLLDRMREVADKPETKIPIIITLWVGSDVSHIKNLGLESSSEIKDPEMSIISGITTSDNIRRISQLPEVETIEYDSSVHALDK